MGDARKELNGGHTVSDWNAVPVSDDHHLGLGRERGFSHWVFVYGWRVAEAMWEAS